MSYEPTEWKNGDIITANSLNNIENGVQNMNSEYVPIVWENGDVITAEKLNNIENGIANGGSSDFSTAEVTFVNDATDADASYVIESIPLIVKEGGLECLTVGSLSVNENSSATIRLPIYGDGYVLITVTTSASDIRVSGHAQLLEGAIIISGDCTITATGDNDK